MQMLKNTGIGWRGFANIDLVRRGPDLKARVRRARGFYIDTVANPGAQVQLGRGREHKSRRPALEYQRRRA